MYGQVEGMRLVSGNCVEFAVPTEDRQEEDMRLVGDNCVECAVLT
jgi:hypothetical protein